MILFGLKPTERFSVLNMQVVPTITVHPLEPVPADSHERLRQYAKELSGKEYSTASPMVTKILERLFREPNIDHQALSCVTTSVLRCDSQIKRAMEVCKQQRSTSLLKLVLDTDFQKSLDTELMHSVLRKTVVKDLKLESVLSNLRATYLNLIVSSNEEVEFQSSVELMISLALQCFKNEYFYSVRSVDEQRFETLKVELSRALDAYHRGIPSPRLIPMLAVYGMYAPLWTLDHKGQILRIKREDLTPSLHLLIDEQIRHPYEERAIKKQIQSLGTSSNKVSCAVGRQYEESPYPRWFSSNSKEPEPFDAWMTERFPHLVSVTPADGTTHILVAGCGTGRHAIALAEKFKNSNVLAVDLSRASLAYAIRKARELGVDRINFYHADILGLSELNTKFHSIEAVGVLHHMEEPSRGWQILSELLLPGGFMRLGLYSKRGREYLNPAKEFIRIRKPGAADSDLRTIRQEMIDAEDDSRFKAALQTYDSFTLSEFRDLLAHEHEVLFTLPQIAEILQQLHLEFVGFEYLSDDIKESFKVQHPQAHELRDLVLWDSFEREHPHTFESMYRFWVRKRIDS